MKCVFLDRDGVIIKNRNDYVKSWNEVNFLTRSLEALRWLARSEYVLVLVTNQSVVGRGIISLEQAKNINQQVITEIENHRGRIDASYICHHHPDEGCFCRKPAPGMLIRASEELGLDLEHSYLIGDAVSDIQAAQSVGVTGILVLTGRGKEQVAYMNMEVHPKCRIVSDLRAAVKFILEKKDGRF